MSNLNDPKEVKDRPQTVTNDPGEAITKPKEVEESNDEKIDEDYPGYPHYPAKDDILNPENNQKRVNLDVESLSRSHSTPEDYLKSISGKNSRELVKENDSEEDINTTPGVADITAEDLALLGDRDAEMDNGEDYELKRHGWRPETGEDMDVPVDEAQDDKPGFEDEENDYYSLGGDEKESLEENDEQKNV